ncbi:MAG: hypothetical protein KUG78_14365 [Kangiellaceae bacterium]|nr:hypothetical protein [Kangiellaceae bacterium]
MGIRVAVTSDLLVIQKLVLSLSHFYWDDSTQAVPEWLLKTIELGEFESRMTRDQYT